MNLRTTGTVESAAILRALALAGGSLIFGASAFILVLRRYTLVGPPDGMSVWAPAVLLWAALMYPIYRWLRGKRTWPILLVCAPMTLYAGSGTAFAAYALLNCAGDASPEIQREAPVIRAWERGVGGTLGQGRSRGSVYFVEIGRPWSDSAPTTLQVSLAEYRRILDGDKILHLKTRAGRLGHEHLSVGSRPSTGLYRTKCNSSQFG